MILPTSLNSADSTASLTTLTLTTADIQAIWDFDITSMTGAGRVLMDAKNSARNAFAVSV